MRTPDKHPAGAVPGWLDAARTAPPEGFTPVAWPEDRQGRIRAVFGYDSVHDAARTLSEHWLETHPDEPLELAALLHGLEADMNAALPEPFHVDGRQGRYILGPALPKLPDDWADTSGLTFAGMDLHLERCTKAAVKAWRAAGNGGYPWEL